jgi:hypothetical protein
MGSILLAVNWLDNDMWFALPLIVAMSLVYSATRHEETVPILSHAVRFGLTVLGVMAAIFAVLLVISWWL